MALHLCMIIVLPISRIDTKISSAPLCLEHRFSNQKPNPPAPFPTSVGGALLPSPTRGGVGGEVLQD
ncbi:hypothetical protein NIES4073_19050 [Kalymmatonema gypsitolerans NIES-4073]|nr:hypothetical protein NIES4073_19050 [Scytonema sp. NIES-4073]